MASDPATWRRIVLATDLTSVSEPATVHALRLAQASGATIVVVNVIEEGDLHSDSAGSRRIDQVRSGREASARQVVARARQAGVAATFLIWPGTAASGVLEAAISEGADAIVVGTHGRGTVGRLVFGSVSREVARKATCPVVVVSAGHVVIAGRG
ncbi:MAG: universal stress protein [Candidatus Limnocylindrales bacterium]